MARSELIDVANLNSSKYAASPPKFPITVPICLTCSITCLAVTKKS